VGCKLGCVDVDGEVRRKDGRGDGWVGKVEPTTGLLGTISRDGNLCKIR
jgi:hypothetical protein